MSVIYNEIQARHGRRCDIEAAAKKLKPPSIHSKASKSDFSKLVNSLTEDFQEECLLVTHDFKVLRLALHMIETDKKVDIEKYVKEAWDEVPMTDELKQAVDQRAYEEAEAREKSAKSDKRQGELDGQLKIFDDGSTPEAGECVTVNDITPESHRLVDYGNLAEVTTDRVPPTFDEIVKAFDEDIDTSTLPGKDITDEQLDADIAKAEAAAAKKKPANKLAEKAAAKKKDKK